MALVNDYLQKNFSDSLLTVDGIARHLNFNTSYLCALYKRKTGRIHQRGAHRRAPGAGLYVSARFFHETV